MTAMAIEERTYLPQQPDQLAPVLDFLTAHERRRGARAEPSYALVGTSGGQRIELPREIHEVLVQVVAALQAGKAVTVAPHSMSLTTQQAADILGVSRPTVVKLIENGELPAERVSSRRRLRLRDVLIYQQARKEAQYEVLAATGVEIDDTEDPEVVRRRLRDARRTVAARRKAKS
ncbi:helix-turn-helix domain-containing protein [Nocardia sp. BSTN01]|uniref:helix-turn-helix domain-containing protein n=1 Tax=Nocardia sp. BSTN01 TaxID=2783665 RepID=UPI001890579E|nr:helix-turn-helix domain-containing protein [Nocardia sp. BSTN01]MBF4996491.1 helix-turn-helix domain-containing protein [Nocardia sp. BSTN01]